MAGVHTRALTAPRLIKPTSPRCRSAWQPNLGRGSTYRRGKSVQTTGTTSHPLSCDCSSSHSSNAASRSKARSMSSSVFLSCGIFAISARKCARCASRLYSSNLENTYNLPALKGDLGVNVLRSPVAEILLAKAAFRLCVRAGQASPNGPPLANIFCH
jgi:hypothetical protein